MCEKGPELKSKIRFPFHPFLLGLYPGIALLAFNVQEIRFSEGLRSLFVSLAGACVLLLVLRLLIRDWNQAALVCSLSLVLFFSYGHIYSFLKQVDLFGMLLGRHRLLLPVWFFQMHSFLSL